MLYRLFYLTLFIIFSNTLSGQKIDEEYQEVINYFKNDFEVYEVIVEKWNLNLFQKLKLKRKYYKNGVFQFNIHKRIFPLALYKGHFKREEKINLDSIRKVRSYIIYHNPIYHNHFSTNKKSKFILFFSELIGRFLIVELQIIENINYNISYQDYKRVNFLFEFGHNKKIKRVSYLTIIP